MDHYDERVLQPVDDSDLFLETRILIGVGLDLTKLCSQSHFTYSKYINNELYLKLKDLNELLSFSLLVVSLAS